MSGGLFNESSLTSIYRLMPNGRMTLHLEMNMRLSGIDSGGDVSGSWKLDGEHITIQNDNGGILMEGRLVGHTENNLTWIIEHSMFGNDGKSETWKRVGDAEQPPSRNIVAGPQQPPSRSVVPGPQSSPGHNDEQYSAQLTGIWKMPRDLDPAIVVDGNLTLGKGGTFSARMTVTRKGTVTPNVLCGGPWYVSSGALMLNTTITSDERAWHARSVQRDEIVSLTNKELRTRRTDGVEHVYTRVGTATDVKVDLDQLVKDIDSQRVAPLVQGTKTGMKYVGTYVDEQRTRNVQVEFLSSTAREPIDVTATFRDLSDTRLQRQYVGSIRSGPSNRPAEITMVSTAPGPLNWVGRHSQLFENIRTTMTMSFEGDTLQCAFEKHAEKLSLRKVAN